jgi:chitin biosynthesis protein CHS5
VDITVSQNHAAEQKSQAAFESLQSQILNAYGLHAPSTPVLRLRNATQTSIVLEWDPIELATSTLRSLALYRSGSKAGNIPKPFEMSSTKISGLQPDSDYSFHLVLRTSGGTFTSNTLNVKTHAMNNLTGITVTPGVLPPQLRESLEGAIERIGAKIVDTVRIDTTHFICTEGRGKDWERAREMNIPVVRPEWIQGCEREGKIIGVRDYYLDANPKNRQIGSNPSLSSTQPQAAPPTPSIMSPASEAAVRASQIDLPSRPAPTSPDEDSPVSGEPGPELPPSPPAKDEVKPVRPEQDDESDEDDEEMSEKHAEAKGAQQDGDDDSEEEVEKADIPTSQSKHPRAEGGSEMEEVAL